MDLGWNEFEGHYTIQSCIEAALAEHFETTNKCPKAIELSPYWYRELLLDIYSQHRIMYLEPEDLKRPSIYNTMYGPVELRINYEIPKERIFEFKEE